MAVLVVHRLDDVQLVRGRLDEGLAPGPGPPRAVPQHPAAGQDLERVGVVPIHQKGMLPFARRNEDTWRISLL